MRFHKSIKIAPGLRINLGKTGLSSLSMGRRGATISLGRTGAYANIGLPGTGLSHRMRLGGDSGTSGYSSRGGRRSADGLTAKERKEIHIASLERQVEAKNQAIEEGLNQHRKIGPIPDQYTFEANLNPPPKPGVPRMVWEVIALLAGLFFIKSFGGILILGAMAAYGYKLYRRQEELAKWRETVADLEAEGERQKALYEGVLRGDREDVEKWLQIIFNQLDWFLETTVSFDLSWDGRNVAIDVDLPEIEDIPSQTSYVKKTSQTIEQKARKPLDVNNDYLMHVHSIVLRLAGEIFCQVPSIEKALISGYTQRKSAGTGQIQDDYVLSVLFDKASWRRLNPAEADPVSFVGRYNPRRDIGPDKILGVITPYSL